MLDLRHHPHRPGLAPAHDAARRGGPRGDDERFSALESRVLDQFAARGRARRRRRAGADARRPLPAAGPHARRRRRPRRARRAHAGAAARALRRALRARSTARARCSAAGRIEFELHRVVGTRAIEPVPFDAHELGDADASAALTGEREAYFEPAGFIATPVYDGDRAARRATVAGPAIVQRMGDSVVVPPDYEALVDGYLTLRLGADRGVGQSAVHTGVEVGPMTLDPVTFEVIRHRLWAINDDQAMIAARLSGSPVVYEALDFNAALVTGRRARPVLRASTSSSTARRSTTSSSKVLEEWPAGGHPRGRHVLHQRPVVGRAARQRRHPRDARSSGTGELVAWSGIVMHDDDVGSPVPGQLRRRAARPLRRGAAVPGDQDGRGLRAARRHRARLPAQQPHARAQRAEHARAPRRDADRPTSASTS